jgi:hypothetical protein
VTDPAFAPVFDWEAAGRKLGATLDAFHAVIVTGSDPVATGYVALGIGRAQAGRRRAAVGDLFADSPPILSLVGNDDPHGLVDSFLYGVSLGRIAHLVPDAGQLFVMASGSEPPVYEEMLPNPRWKRLTAGFHEVGALLVLAVPSSAPHVEDLAQASDGVVVVGDAMPPGLSASMVIAAVRRPREGGPARERVVERAAATAGERRPESTAATASMAASTISATSADGARSSRGAAMRRQWKQWRPSVPGVVLSVAIVAAIAWLAYRPMSRGGRSTLGPKPDSMSSLKTVLPATGGSPTGTSAAGTTAPPPLRPQNVEDSAQAAGYAVQLMAANTEAGAILKLQQDGKDMPAATFAPVLVQGVRWFKVISGAYVDRADADSLLARFRRRGLLAATSGGVVRVPFAFLIEPDVPTTAVPGMVATYADHGQPVYALRQSDGKIWLLVGAFESADEAALYAESLRASGITPVLVYRKGRTF